MADYVDGFAYPIPREHLDDYRRTVNAIAAIWKEHGAREYREVVGDDLRLEGTQSFADMLNARDDEVVLFGWVVFDSREARDLAGQRVASDPRVAQLMASSAAGFDASRMAYGGFRDFLGGERDAD